MAGWTLVAVQLTKYGVYFVLFTIIQQFFLMQISRPSPNPHLRTFITITTLCLSSYLAYSFRKWELILEKKQEVLFSLPFFLHSWCSHRASLPLAIQLTNVKPQQYLSVIFFHHPPPCPNEFTWICTPLLSREISWVCLKITTLSPCCASSFSVNTLR